MRRSTLNKIIKQEIENVLREQITSTGPGQLSATCKTRTVGGHDIDFLGMYGKTGYFTVSPSTVVWDKPLPNIKGSDYIEVKATKETSTKALVGVPLGHRHDSEEITEENIEYLGRQIARAKGLNAIAAWQMFMPPDKLEALKQMIEQGPAGWWDRLIGNKKGQQQAFEKIVAEYDVATYRAQMAWYHPTTGRLGKREFPFNNVPGKGNKLPEDFSCQTLWFKYGPTAVASRPK